MSDIYVRGCETGVEAHGAEGMVHDITIKNSNIFYTKEAKNIDAACKFRWKRTFRKFRKVSFLLNIQEVYLTTVSV